MSERAKTEIALHEANKKLAELQAKLEEKEELYVRQKIGEATVPVPELLIEKAYPRLSGRFGAK